MRSIYITMMLVCAAISIMVFDNFPAFTGWLSATMAYSLAAMERS